MTRHTMRRVWIGTLAAALLIGPAAAQNSPPSGPAAGAPPKPVPRVYADSDRCRRSDVEIINESSNVVREVYLRPSGQINGFGEDRLGAAQLLGPGARLVLDPGQGVFDLLVLRASGQPLVLMRFNPCAIAQLRVTDADLLAQLRRRS